LIKSFGKSEHGCCDHKTSRNNQNTDAGCLQMGRVGIRKKKEGRRESAELTYINFYRRFHWRNIRRWLRRWFWRKHRHVTVRICHFKSLGESVGNLNGEPVTSLYGLSFWIRRWFRRKKITRQNLHVSDPPFFLIRKRVRR